MAHALEDGLQKEPGFPGNIHLLLHHHGTTSTIGTGTGSRAPSGRRRSCLRISGIGGCFRGERRRRGFPCRRSQLFLCRLGLLRSLCSRLGLLLRCLSGSSLRLTQEGCWQWRWLR